MHSAGSVRVRPEIGIQKDVGIDVNAVPVIQSAGHGKIKQPRNKRKQDAQKIAPGQLPKLSEASAGQDYDDRKSEKKAHKRELHAEDKAAAKTGKENVLRGECCALFRGIAGPGGMIFAGGSLQAAHQYIQRIQQKRQTQLLGAAAPVKALGGEHAG